MGISVPKVVPNSFYQCKENQTSNNTVKKLVIHFFLREISNTLDDITN